jgi:hypothetical protein
MSPFVAQAVRKLKNSKRDENDFLKFNSKLNVLVMWAPKAISNE